MPGQRIRWRELRALIRRRRRSRRSLLLLRAVKSVLFLVEVRAADARAAEEEKERVFERFYRARYDIAGSGVGLSMVKDILDHHHAHIEILDTQPKGTTFQVDIDKLSFFRGQI